MIPIVFIHRGYADYLVQVIQQAVRTCGAANVYLLGDEAIAWLNEHCWEYGFIVRYRAEKAEITGIIDEPWHFRYVGVKVAMELKDSDLCLEEYLGAVE